MKKNSILFPVLGMMLLASCSSQFDGLDTDFTRDGEVTFSSSIATTRAMDSKWHNGDAIGVFAFAGNSNVVHDGKENVKHTTSVADGTERGFFTPSGNAIKFPQNGAPLDFVAYYPYKDGVKEAYDIDVTDQTNSAAIDVLYSNNAKGKKKVDGPVVGLNFKHQLSMLRLDIKAGEGVSLDGLTATIDGLNAKATMSMKDGAVTMTANSVATLTPQITIAADKASATLAAILVPGQDLQTAKFTFTLGGKTYKWSAPKSIMMVGGTKYTYPLTLNSASVEVTIGKEGATTNDDAVVINDWNESSIGTGEELNPEAGTTTPTPAPATTLEVSTAALAFDAEANLTSDIKVTSNQKWTVAESADWLTVSATSGENDQTITVTATANTDTAERTADITITGADNQAKTIKVTQKGKAAVVTPPATGATLLAPWSNFEDFAAFQNALSAITKDFIQSAPGEGVDGSGAIKITGNSLDNKNGFTIAVKDDIAIAGKSKLVFWVKGTANGKSISCYVYTGTETSERVTYNLLDLSKGNPISPEGASSNSYGTGLDTKGEWVKVEFDLTGVTPVSTLDAKLIEFRCGKSGVFDLLIDNITVE